MEDTWIRLRNIQNKEIFVRTSFIGLVCETDFKISDGSLQTGSLLKCKDGTKLVVQEHAAYIIPWLGTVVNAKK
jgi:sporulation protein YlmC with PRC-barrel domain